MLEGRDRPLSDDHKTIIITGIGETLAFFERYGIQHWDLHTGNVMVNRNTSEPTIVDFGAVGLTTADKRRLSNENSSSAPNLPDIQAFYSIVREMFVDFRREEGPSPPSTLEEIVELAHDGLTFTTLASIHSLLSNARLVQGHVSVSRSSNGQQFVVPNVAPNGIGYISFEALRRSGGNFNAYGQYAREELQRLQ
ncbi:hypothetical protein HKX48_004367 [Thoreauomyces humboldtii]|nr:hypothetical protein HKX48_004356 [Thoreauomyces humboldtii]KAJ3023073.1 hypothetical protein HKX48_004367 [Thoreauomyces humboldtii]